LKLGDMGSNPKECVGRGRNLKDSSDRGSNPKWNLPFDIDAKGVERDYSEAFK
jgi:hypothetical protein